VFLQTVCFIAVSSCQMFLGTSPNYQCLFWRYKLQFCESDVYSEIFLKICFECILSRSLSSCLKIKPFDFKIPAAPAYGAYLSQLIRYTRACGSYRDFLYSWLLLTRKLHSQGFLLVKLKSSHWKYYGSHHNWLV
jgi:hypothetical protein